MENAQPFGHDGGNRDFRSRAQSFEQPDAQAIMNEAQVGTDDADDSLTLQLLRRPLDVAKRTVQGFGDTGKRRSISPEGKCGADFENIGRKGARARYDGVGDIVPINARRSRAVDNPGSVLLCNRRPFEKRSRGFLQIERQSGVVSSQPGVDDGTGGMIADRFSQQHNLIFRTERPEFDEFGMRPLRAR